MTKYITAKFRLDLKMEENLPVLRIFNIDPRIESTDQIPLCTLVGNEAFNLFDGFCEKLDNNGYMTNATLFGEVIGHILSLRPMAGDSKNPDL